MTSVDTTEGRLSQAAMRALAGSRTPKFLATRNADAVSNVVPVLSLEAADEQTIIFAEMMIWKTRRNLEADPRLAIMVLAPDLRGWTVRGRFLEFQTTGPHFEHVMAGENVRYNPYGGIRSAGVIQVEEVTRTFKVSQAGLLLEAARSRWLARRLARDGRSKEACLPDRQVMPVQVSEKFSRLRAAKALAFLDAGGHPDCLPALSLVPAGRARLVFGGATAAEDMAGLAPGSLIAAAVLSLEPVAYQVKGEFAGLRNSLGRRLGVIDVREAYSACPPLPGQRLPGGRQGSVAAP
jgi:hypothetical protein